jgi:dual specificity tyrosine-phosphorylation-regulated kinase 2/3/4
MSSNPPKNHFTSPDLNSPTSNQSHGLILNSARVALSKQSKLVDSKMSDLRHAHDSTAASKVLTPQFPMSPEDAYKLFSNLLWDVERREIFEFETIYFFPVEERKKLRQKGSLALTMTGSQSEMGVFNDSTNNGFDSDSNEYLSRVNEHLAYRYEVVKKVGKGSFGVVMKCYDHKQKEYIAVKILKNKARLYEQGLVEAKLIRHLNDHDREDKKNIIRRLDQCLFRKHLLITFEMLSVNLYEFIKMNNFNGFSLNLIKRFAIQILISLYFLSEHNIVHCDLKPENILLRKINKSGIKIIDFGSGCFDNEKIYTYIQSRFYRAPEIVLGIAYNGAIDMWSFGCILYELYIGYPLFPGEDEKEHMALMMEVKGIPPRSVLARSSRRKVFFDEDYNPIITPNSRGRVRVPGSKNLHTLMQCSDRDFVDFIDKCIEWKPEKRLTPENAFSHNFISKAVNELKCLRKPDSATQQQE